MNAAIDTGSVYRALGGMGRRRPVRRRRGAGFFGDLWSGIKKAAGWVKDNKIVSRGLNLISDPRARALGSAAAAVGLGRRRRAPARRRRVVRRRRGGMLRRVGPPPFVGMWPKTSGLGRRRRAPVRRRRGGNRIMGALKKLHSYVKDKRLVSSALKHFGYSRAGNVAHAAGYGKLKRRKRVYRRRR